MVWREVLDLETSDLLSGRTETGQQLPSLSVPLNKVDLKG